MTAYLHHATGIAAEPRVTLNPGSDGVPFVSVDLTPDGRTDIAVHDAAEAAGLRDAFGRAAVLLGAADERAALVLAAYAYAGVPDAERLTEAFLAAEGSAS